MGKKEAAKISESNPMTTSTETWRHPTGREPKSVLIPALGPTKTDLLEMTTSHVPPDLLMGCDEVWGINAGANWLGGRVAYDLLWVMDYLDGEAKKYPRYVELLATWAERHGSPVMTSRAGYWGHDRKYVHEYPLGWVVKKLGSENAYFHNSLPYMLAYALAIGVERLVIFGADYSHERSKRREDDRANAEYWIGICRHAGMDVWLPDSTTLCSTNRQPWFYGYPPHDQPEIEDLVSG